MSVDLLQKLAGAGLDMGLVMEVAQAIADANAKAAAAIDILERRRSKDRERKRGNDGTPIIPRNSTEATEPPAGARADTQTNNSSGTHSKNKEEEKGKGGADAPLALLSAVIDPERAQAVIEHRKRLGKGKALTPGTAKSLAKRLGEFPDPNAAADEMMLRGWASIDASWDGARRATGPPGRPTNGHSPPPLTGYTQVLHELRRQREEDPRDLDEPAVPLLPRH